MTEDHRIISRSERIRLRKIGPPLKDGETRLCGDALSYFHDASGKHTISSSLLTSNSCRYESCPNARRQVSEKTGCPLHSGALCKSSCAYTKREQGLCAHGQVIIYPLSSLPHFKRNSILIMSVSVFYIMSVMGYGMLLASKKPSTLSFRYATCLAQFPLCYHF